MLNKSDLESIRSIVNEEVKKETSKLEKRIDLLTEIVVTSTTHVNTLYDDLLHRVRALE